MALNATGTLNANSGVAGTNIALEFGWTPPFSLATKTPRGTVPTSAFNLSAFRGQSNGPTIVPTLTAWNARGDGVAGSTTRGQINFLNDGTISGSYLGGSATIGSTAWATPTNASNGAGYYIKITVTAGTATTNTASTWVSLSTGKSISKSGTTGSATCNFTVQIATDAAGTNVVSSGTGFSIGYDHTA